MKVPGKAATGQLKKNLIWVLHGGSARIEIKKSLYSYSRVRTA
jgi:hypothetical protein